MRVIVVVAVLLIVLNGVPGAAAEGKGRPQQKAVGFHLSRWTTLVVVAVSGTVIASVQLLRRRRPHLCPLLAMIGGTVTVFGIVSARPTLIGAGALMIEGSHLVERILHCCRAFKDDSPHKESGGG